MKFYISFAQRYRREPHPTFPEVRNLPDKLWEVEASDEYAARWAAVTTATEAWFAINSEEHLPALAPFYTHVFTFDPKAPDGRRITEHPMREALANV